MIFILNFAQWAPIQFTTPFYMALAIFDHINNHKDLNNGELSIGHFLYYFWLGRLSRNNRTPKSPVKKGQNAAKRKAVANKPKDKNKWLRW